MGIKITQSFFKVTKSPQQGLTRGFDANVEIFLLNLSELFEKAPALIQEWKVNARPDLSREIM